MSINGDVLIKLAGLSDITPPPKDLSIGAPLLSKHIGSYLDDPKLERAKYNNFRPVTPTGGGVAAMTYPMSETLTWPQRFARDAERGIHRVGNKLGVDKVISHIRNQYNANRALVNSGTLPPYFDVDDMIAATKPNNNVSVSAYIPTWPERFAENVERGIHRVGNKLGVDKVISHIRNQYSTPNR